MEPRSAPGRVRVLLPDLALALSLFAAFYSLVFYNAPEQLFRDADAGWHIVTGERILTAGVVPRVDEYSFSRPAAAWFAWEWLADIAMGLAHKSAGLRGVALLYIAAIALSIWLWTQLSFACGANFFAVCVLASPMLTTAQLHWLARPHLFSWVLLLIALFLLERGRMNWRWAFAIGLLWANLHGSFFLLPLLCAIYGLPPQSHPAPIPAEPEPPTPSRDRKGAPMARGGPRKTMKPRRASVPNYLLPPHLLPPFPSLPNRVFNGADLPQPQISTSRKALPAALAAIAASFVNPYGWQLHTHLFSYLRNTELLSRVAEFQSFNFHSEGAWQVGVVLLIGMAGFVCALAMGQWSRAVTLLLLSAMALRTARGLPVLAMAGLPLAAGAISAALTAWTLLPPVARRALDYGNRLQKLQAPLRGYIPGVILFSLLALAVLGSHSGFPAKEFPLAAAERIPEGARLLAPDKYGGYLIYRFKGTQKVYFDGRSDYYGAAFMKEFVDLVEVRSGYEEIVKKYGFTHALLPPRYSLIPALERAGWTRLYADETSVLLQRNF